MLTPLTCVGFAVSNSYSIAYLLKYSREKGCFIKKL